MSNIVFYDGFLEPHHNLWFQLTIFIIEARRNSVAFVYFFLRHSTIHVETLYGSLCLKSLPLEGKGRTGDRPMTVW